MSHSTRKRKRAQRQSQGGGLTARNITKNLTPTLFSKTVLAGSIRIVLKRIVAWAPYYDSEGPEKRLAGCRIYYLGGQLALDVNQQQAAAFLRAVGDTEHEAYMAPSTPAVIPPASMLPVQPLCIDDVETRALEEAESPTL